MILVCAMINKDEAIIWVPKSCKLHEDPLPTEVASGAVIARRLNDKRGIDLCFGSFWTYLILKQNVVLFNHELRYLRVLYVAEKLCVPVYS